MLHLPTSVNRLTEIRTPDAAPTGRWTCSSTGWRSWRSPAAVLLGSLR